MKTLKFMGHSDDTFGEYGTTMDDVDNAGSGTPIQCVVEADGTALIVTGQYDRNGTGAYIHDTPTRLMTFLDRAEAWRYIKQHGLNPEIYFVEVEK